MRTLWLASPSAVLLSTFLGWAQNATVTNTPSDRDRASALFKAANALRDAGENEAALQRYVQAHALANTSVTAYALGIAHQRLGQLLEARSVLASISRIPVAPRESARSQMARQEAVKLIAELDAKTPRLRVTLVGTSSGQVPVSVQLDNSPARQIAGDQEWSLNPGRHVVQVVVATATKPKQTEVVLGEGETRTLEIPVDAWTEPVPAPVGPQVSTNPTPNPAQVPAPGQPSGPPVSQQQASPTQPSDTQATKSALSRPRWHDGFYLRFGLGGGEVVGTVDSETTVSGESVGFDGTVGGAVGSGLILGGTFLFSISPDVRSDEFWMVATGLLGLTVDWYPNPAGGLHLQSTLGVGSTRYHYREGERLGDSASVRKTALGVVPGLGYEGWVSDGCSMGGLLRTLVVIGVGDAKELDENGDHIEDGSADMNSIALELLGTITFN